jgi:SulP family sulfate permease
MMPVLQTLRREWLFNVRGDALAGIVVALALVPEAIAFSIIAGVDPQVGLYASVVIAITIACIGGRPGMVSAATGAMALLMTDLVREHGLQYLLAASILTGVLQAAAGLLRLGSLMRFISRSVITGFVNALAILIFIAQLPEILGNGWVVYVLVAIGLAIIYLLPRVTRVVPSTLACIVVLTAITLVLNLDIRQVGDLGGMPTAWPVLSLPSVPFTLDTLRLLLPYSATLAFVGLLESLLTATLIDDLTHTTSSRHREVFGQGVANIFSGLFGGMAGCAMIGQSVVNVKSGGRGRLSTLTAGVVLLALLLFFSKWVAAIPLAALVAVMIMVSIGMFNWDSLRNLASHPKSSSAVMIITTIVIVVTRDLAEGVLAGVLLSALFFARKIGQFLHVEVTGTGGRSRSYVVTGQIFFASAERFVAAFDLSEAIDTVRIDLTHARLWDLTAVTALNKVVMKFRREGTMVGIVGLDEASRTLLEKLATPDQAESRRLMSN